MSVTTGKDEEICNKWKCKVVNEYKEFQSQMGLRKSQLTFFFFFSFFNKTCIQKLP